MIIIIISLGILVETLGAASPSCARYAPNEGSHLQAELSPNYTQRSASGTRVPGIPRPGPGFSGPGLGPGQTFSCGRGTGTEGPVPLGTRDGTRD